MALETILLKVVANGILKGILNIWLEDGNINKEMAHNFADVLTDKGAGAFAADEGERQFKAIRAGVAKNLLPLFKTAGADISEDHKEEIAQLAGKAINNLRLSPELLVARNLNPKAIEKLLLDKAIFPNDEDPLIKYNEAEKALYHRVLTDASQYMVDIAASLPRFTATTFSEVLTRQDQILDKANAILEEVRRMQEQSISTEQKAREFEENYRRAVVRNLDELELFGVDLSGTSKRYRLSVAYVSLSVEYAAAPDEKGEEEVDDEEEIVDNTEFISINEAIRRSNRLLLRGPAGSGKTTLLKWIAVMAAGLNLEDDLEEWNQCVPFFIRLRNFADKALPKPEEFPSLTSQAISGEMPSRWVADKLKNGQAIILVDGVDELAQKQREKVKAWLKDIDGTYPNNKWLVTSRPYAADKDWLTDFGFMNAELLDMGGHDVEQFIEHWHHAVKEVEPNQVRKEELDSLSLKLKDSIRSKRNLRKLATNPLLCAMICALHRDRSTQLPAERVALYDACINMFLRRDQEREVVLEDYVEIGDRQKRVLLADFAYYMMNNGWSEVTIENAERRMGAKLAGLRDIPEETTSTGIRRYFVERSGILRQPTAETIDFPHRTFEEFLAAEAIIEAGDFGVLIKHVGNDQWREVIQLACGLARPNEAEKLVQEVILLGDKKEKEKAQIYLLAVSCLDTTVEINPDVKNEVQKRLKSLVPPSNITQAKELAKAGELVLPYLKYNLELNVKEATACIRCLALIRGSASIDLIEEYTKDTRTGVKDELMRSLKYLDHNGKLSLIRKVIAEMEQLGQLTELDLSQKGLNELPAEIWKLQDLRDLYLYSNQLSSLPAEIGQLQNLRSLYLSSNQLSSLPPEIGQLQNLSSLDLYENKLSSWPPEIGQLQNLSSLDLGHNQLRSLPPEIGQSVNLRNLNLCFNQLSSLPVEIGQLVNLRELDLYGNHLGSLPAEIGQLQNLSSLDLRGNQLSSLPAEIWQLQNLSSLDLRGNELSSLPPEIEQLQNLRSLSLGFSQWSSLPAEIGRLQNLSSLDLGFSQLSSLPAEIGRLQNLSSLDLRGNQLSSLPIEIWQLTDLSSLDLSDNLLRSLPAEIGQLQNLGSLDLRDNRLRSLPAAIGRLQNLSSLDLGSNELSSLPAAIGEMRSLEYLFLYGNPIPLQKVEALHQSMPWCEIIF